MKLYIVRHGDAGPNLPWPDDRERVLTADGRDEIHRIGRRLKALKVAPDVILCSPFPRALGTAEILAAELGCKDALQPNDRLEAGADPGDFQAALEGSATAMVVGHEPDLSEFIEWLTGASVVLKKGGVALVDCDRLEPDRGVLLWLAPPKLLLAP